MTEDDDQEFSARIAEVAERDRKARLLLEEIHQNLPKDLTGVVMVNADNGEWVNGKNKHNGWEKAREKWGPDICHPPVWMIVLTEEPEVVPSA